MKCFLCKGELREQLTNFMIDVDNCFIIVKNVPSQVCSQCGEVSYSDEVAAKLERIVKAVRKAVSEVAIVNYQDSVVCSFYNFHREPLSAEGKEA